MAFPWAAIGSMFAGGLGAASASNQARPESIDIDKIKDYLSPTQGLVNEQLELSRKLQDPQSAINLQMRKLMSQRASETGQEIGSQSMKLGAMRNMSPGQIMMQSRMGMNEAQSGVNQKWIEMMQQRFGQGLGLMGDMTGRQLGLDENLGNAYVRNINAMNQFKTDKASSTVSGLLGGLKFGMDQWGG